MKWSDAHAKLLQEDDPRSDTRNSFLSLSHAYLSLQLAAQAPARVQRRYGSTYGSLKRCAEGGCSAPSVTGVDADARVLTLSGRNIRTKGPVLDSTLSKRPRGRGALGSIGFAARCVAHQEA